jgi:hypothetical protein
MLQQIRLNSLVGQNLEIMMQWAQVEAGISQPILLNITARLPQLTEHKYITSLRKYLLVSGMGLHLKAIRPPKIKREHDEVLMDWASAMTKAQMSDRIFELINRCRKFLRVKTMADVTTADGKYICEHAFACNPEVRVRSEKLWPVQPHVGNINTKSWQWFLKLWCKDGSRELRQPLGKWLIEPVDRGWNAYYIEATNTAMTKEGNEWREHRILEKHRNEWLLCDHHATKTESEIRAIGGKIPVEGWLEEDGLVGIGKPQGSMADWNPSGRTTVRAKDWEEYKAALPECVREILKGCTEIHRKDKPDLMDILLSETKVLNICSDGGHINNRGSYGWVMAAAGTVIYQGKGHARGYPMSSYRAEAYGKLAWLLFFLHHYCECFGITINCSIRSYYDNLEVIKQTRFYSWMDKVWDCLRPDCDILVEIVHVQDSLRAKAPYMIAGQWIKGHQDAKTALDKLPLPALLNIKADGLATEVHRSISNHDKQLPTIPWTQCRATLYVDGKPYTRAETFQLRWKWRESEFQGYLIDRWGLETGDIQRINWAGYRLTRNKMTLAVRTFSTKLLIGWLATGTWMEKYGNRLTNCHRCDGVETVDHIFRCPENRALFSSFLTDFESFLVSIKTKPAIIDDMLRGIQLWAAEENNSGFTATQRETQRYQESEQARFGFNLMLRGILASDWSERQQVFIINTRGAVRGTEADTWSSKITTWLINEAQTIWKARNEELHRPTSPDNQQIARAALELQARVRELYEQKDNVNYQDRDLFEIPLESRLQQLSVSIMRAWVASTSKTLGICIEYFAAATARSNSNIRDHLPIRTRAPTLPPPTAQAAAADASATSFVQEAARPTETLVLLDTSSSDSSDSDSNSEKIGRQSINIAIQAFAGRTRRRVKGQAHTKQRRRERRQTSKESDMGGESDTASESDTSQESNEPPIAKKFTPKPKRQSTLTSFNFVREKAPRQQTPKASEINIEETRPNHQEWFSPQPEQHRRREISSGSRVWDAGRTNREGVGGPARVVT